MWLQCIHPYQWIIWKNWLLTLKRILASWIMLHRAMALYRILALKSLSKIQVWISFTYRIRVLVLQFRMYWQVRCKCLLRHHLRWCSTYRVENWKAWLLQVKVVTLACRMYLQLLKQAYLLSNWNLGWLYTRQQVRQPQSLLSWPSLLRKVLLYLRWKSAQMLLV